MALELTIEKLVYGGEGLARVDGEVVFTPFVLPGELVEVAPPASKKSAQRASLIRVMQPSQDRVEPLCPIFGACGGVPLPAHRLSGAIAAEALHSGRNAAARRENRVR